MKNANIINNSETIIDTPNIFFSIIFFIAIPKLPIKNAIKKNLDPLVIADTIKK